MAPALSARRRGFTWPSWLQLSWSWRITWLYLALVLFLPLGALALKAAAVGPSQFWQLATSPEALATYRISFGLAFVAALLNGVFGLVIAWALVRCSFPGRRLLDSLIDLPFALPTAVAGIALCTLYAPNGWVGAWLAGSGPARDNSREIAAMVCPLRICLTVTFNPASLARTTIWNRRNESAPRSNKLSSR